MQRLAWQRWIEIGRRLGTELEPALTRLLARRSELGLALALAVFFMVVGGLSPSLVLVGLAAIQAGARQPLSPGIRAEARGLLARFIEAQLGRRLKSVDFLRGVGVD